MSAKGADVRHRRIVGARIDVGLLRLKELLRRSWRKGPKTFFRVRDGPADNPSLRSNRPEMSKNVEICMADILVQLIDECVTLPTEVLEILLANFNPKAVVRG